MGKVAFVELVGGVSGDMLLSALRSLGVSFAPLEQAFAEQGWKIQYSFRRIRVSEIYGWTAKVKFPEGSRWNLKTARKAIQKLPLSAPGKKKGMEILASLMEAEAKVHGVPRVKVHLHEVGSLDTLADVTGAVFGFEQLGVGEIFYSDIPMGSGRVKALPGDLPNPPPVVLHLSQGLKIRREEIPLELSTPTGVAILRGLGQQALPAFRFLSCGYGFGSRRSFEHSALRIWLGEKDPAGEEMVEIETLVDDLSPEVMADICGLLLERGALEAYITPVVGKKGRPAFLLSTLTGRKNLPALLETIFQETTTLGVRWKDVKRLALPRENVEVHTPYGKVPVKVAYWEGKVVTVKPEYEVCRALARKLKVPLKSVMLSAVREFRKSKSQEG